MRVQFGDLLPWLHFFPKCLIEVVDVCHVGALTVVDLATKEHHVGFMDHGTMAFQFSWVVFTILRQLLPLEAIHFVFELQSIEIGKETLIDIVPAMHVQMGTIDDRNMVGSGLNVLANDFELHPSVVNLLRSHVWWWNLHFELGGVV